jgi:hypothetical protein
MNDKVKTIAGASYSANLTAKVEEKILEHQIAQEELSKILPVFPNVADVLAALTKHGYTIVKTVPDVTLSEVLDMKLAEVSGTISTLLIATRSEEFEFEPLTNEEKKDNAHTAGKILSAFKEAGYIRIKTTDAAISH